MGGSDSDKDWGPLLPAFAVAYLIMLAVAVAAFVSFWVCIGIVANLLLRHLVGRVGDRLGVTPQVGRIGLTIVFLTPPALLWLVILAVLWGYAIAWQWPVTYFLVFGLPAYYWAWYAGEIPKFHWSLETPYRTEATMRAEEAIATAEMKALLATLGLRLRIFTRVLRSSRNWLDIFGCREAVGEKDQGAKI